MRFRFIFCSFFFISVGIFGNENVNRVLGGITSNIEDYPYIVSLRVDGFPWCGGSIVGERHVLTAAHCLPPKKIKPPYDNLSVFSGTNLSTSTSGDQHLVKSIDFYLDETYYYHDIALITLRKNIRFNEHQNMINLPSRDYAEHGVKATVTGWGLTSFPQGRMSLVLQHAETIIIPSSTCTVFFVDQKPRYKIHDRIVCAFEKIGVSVCLGDSGGPMVVGNELVGITSWVIPCGKGYPDVFTHVYAYMDWIKKIMNLP